MLYLLTLSILIRQQRWLSTVTELATTAINGHGSGPPIIDPGTTARWSRAIGGSDAIPNCEFLSLYGLLPRV